MKNKIIALILCVFLILVCAACGGGNNSNNSNNSNSSNISDVPENTVDPELTPSERSMACFVRKLEAGNYLVEIPKRLRTAIVSPQQAYILFDHEIEDYGSAFMTLNGETFQGWLEDGTLSDITFYSKGTAIDALEELLPNSWLASTNGNLFEYFYGSDEHPLVFTSKDENVKRTMLALSNYNENMMEYMGEVTLTLDAEDPTTAHFGAVMNSGSSMIHYNDIDLTLQFGAATSEPRIEAWLKDPVYPAKKTGWTSKDIADLDMVYMRSYGRDAVPFPRFASYAWTSDKNAYEDFSGFLATDAHATEQDVEGYKKTLLEKGFTETTGTLPDGSAATVYRKLLREEYGAYSQLCPLYDKEDGFTLICTLYHDIPKYEGIAAINEVIEKHSFAPLDETDAITDWIGEDGAGAETESWSYFFDYSLYMPMRLTIKDADAAKAYLDAYGDKLTANGFTKTSTPAALTTVYENPNSCIIFFYYYEGEDKLVMVFKEEKSLNVEQALAALKEHGLPETDLHGNVATRDQTKYYYVLSGFKGLHLIVDQPYESMEAAGKYLDAYVEKLVDQDYLPTDPSKVGSQKSQCFLNIDKGKYVAFDVVQRATGVQISYEMVSIEPDSNSLVSKMQR